MKSKNMYILGTEDQEKRKKKWEGGWEKEMVRRDWNRRREDKKEMKRRNSREERKTKKRDGKAEHAHALGPELFSEKESHLWGYPKLSGLLASLKNLYIGRGCVSESKWMLPPKVSVPTWTGSHGKREGSGSEGKDYFSGKGWVVGWEFNHETWPINKYQ